jgi:uncharacterized protein YciI
MTENFLVKLIPPRPTFSQDMTEEELNAMHEHAAYWRRHLEAREVLLFGPVADPKGTWGLAILNVENERRAKDLANSDPLITGGVGFQVEMYPMRVVHG